MKNLNLFVPITKIDAARRLVYGIATAEAKDRSGEVCDYATTKPLYEKWSGDIEKASDGKSLGNLRAMHGKVAAGKVTSLAFNDDAKQIEICAKVVDDNEWKKVEEGVYTGFSQGGRYVKQWQDPSDPTVTRYTAEPSEVSLVDLPCLPTATFQMIKADGSTELRKFAAVEKLPISHNDIAEKAQELAKADGKETDWIDFLDEARAELTKASDEKPVDDKVEKATDASAAVVEKTVTVVDNAAPAFEQVFICKRDNSQHASEEAVRKHIEALDAVDAAKALAAPALAAIDGIQKSLGIEGEAAADAGDQPASGVARMGLQKGLYSVSRLASVMDELKWMITSAQWDVDNCKDDKTAGLAQMKSAIESLVGALKIVVEEECAELCTAEKMAGTETVVPAGYLAALVKFAIDTPDLAKHAPELEKAGARNSKKDAASLQKAHDELVAAGAVCACAEKAAQPDDLKKALDENPTLQKALAHGETLQKALDLVTERLAEIEKRAMPPKTAANGNAKAVAKSDDARGAAAAAGAEAAEIDLEKVLAAMSSTDRALLLTKAALLNPTSINR